MTQPDPVELLRRGSTLLAPILVLHGYELAEPTVVRGSGGMAAIGIWHKGRRTIETHVRGALGIVAYVWGNDQFGHKDYLRAVDRVGAYPGFSSDPIETFEHLAENLAGVALPLLDMNRDEFHEIAQIIRDLPKPRLP